METEFQVNSEGALASINILDKDKDGRDSECITEWAKKDYISLEQLQKRDRMQPSEPDVNKKPIILISHQLSRQLQYDLSLRNMKHEMQSWTTCPFDHHQIPYDAKIKSGRFPSLSEECRLRWYECKKDMCAVHLRDKRSKLHFPGTEDPQQIMQMQLVISGSCYNVHWQHCLNKGCDLHRDSKRNNGFDDEEPFLRSTHSDSGG